MQRLNSATGDEENQPEDVLCGRERTSRMPGLFDFRASVSDETSAMTLCQNLDTIVAIVSIVTPEKKYPCVYETVWQPAVIGMQGAIL